MSDQRRHPSQMLPLPSSLPLTRCYQPHISRLWMIYQRQVIKCHHLAYDLINPQIWVIPIDLRKDEDK